jgi:hypothetical protein
VAKAGLPASFTLTPAKSQDSTLGVKLAQTLTTSFAARNRDFVKEEERNRILEPRGNEMK